MTPDLALAPLLDTLKDLTRARHVGISHADPTLPAGSSSIHPG